MTEKNECSEPRWDRGGIFIFMQQRQQQQRIAAFLAPLVIGVFDYTEDGTWIMVKTRWSSCDEFAAELIRVITQSHPQRHVCRGTAELALELITTVAWRHRRQSPRELIDPTINHCGILVSWPPSTPPPNLTKLDLEALFLSVLRARRPLAPPRGRRFDSIIIHGPWHARYLISIFLLARVRRKRLHRIGRTAFDRQTARAAVRFPGVRQLLRRRKDGNELAGVFQRKDVASVVAEYLGYSAW